MELTATVEVGSGCVNCLHVLSCCASMFAAIREEKDHFFTSLQDALSAIPSNLMNVL
jgi:hypothetical protein